MWFQFVLYRVLQHGKCFKDVIKNNLRALSVDLGDVEQMTENQSTWKK